MTSFHSLPRLDCSFYQTFKFPEAHSILYLSMKRNWEAVDSPKPLKKKKAMWCTGLVGQEQRKLFLLSASRSLMIGTKYLVWNT